MKTEVILTMLKEQIRNAASKNAKVLIIDGFPRHIDQAVDFERTVGVQKFDERAEPNFFQVLKFDFVVCLTCPTSLVKDRFLGRKLPERPADDLKMFENRVQEFEANNPQIMDHYNSMGILIEVSISLIFTKLY